MKRWIVITFALPLLLASTTAQQKSEVSGIATAIKEPVAASSVALDPRDNRADNGDRYLISPGDILDIRVFNKPQFSRDAVRVDGRGMVRMPLIEGEIQAACHTEADLAQELSKRYLDYIRSPQVDVFIKEFQGQPVAVLGSVRAPSRFQLQRRAHLLEVLSLAGGVTESAGLTIQIVHTAAGFTCNGGEFARVVPGEVDDADYFSLSDTLKGIDGSNPYLRNGDVVSVSEADYVYVVGNVVRPSSIPLKEPITVSRVIAMAGGALPDTKSDKIRIVRQVQGVSGKQELFVDLKAIDKHQAEDIVLQANDIIDVPTSGAKRLLRSLIGATVPAAAQMPVRIIP